MFYLKCNNKHPQRSFPLDSIEVWTICEESHDSKDFLSFLLEKQDHEAIIKIKRGNNTYKIHNTIDTHIYMVH
jgi:hypothetical protein